MSDQQRDCYRNSSWGWGGLNEEKLDKLFRNPVLTMKIRIPALISGGYSQTQNMLNCNQIFLNLTKQFLMWNQISVRRPT